MRDTYVADEWLNGCLIPRTTHQIFLLVPDIGLIRQ